MSPLLGCTMLFGMALILPAVLADTLDSQFTLPDRLMPPGLPIVPATFELPTVTEVDRQGGRRLRGSFLSALIGRPPTPPPRRNHPRALFRHPLPLPPQPLFNHLDHLNNEVRHPLPLPPQPLFNHLDPLNNEVRHPLPLPPQPLFNHIDPLNNEVVINPALKSILKDISMADLPLAGEGENMLPGFFAPEFNDRFTPAENAPIISVVSPPPRLTTTRQTTTELSNQLSLSDQLDTRPLLPAFNQQQVAPPPNQLLLAGTQEVKPQFPTFGPQQVAPQSNRLPLADTQEARPSFPPFNQQRVVPQSNQLPLADTQEVISSFPPFDQHQVVPHSHQLQLADPPFDHQQVALQSNQLPSSDPQETRPLFPPFDQQQVAPQSDQLPLSDPQEARPSFPPFAPQQGAPQFTFQVHQTTTTAPVVFPETSSQQFPFLVPDTLKSIFPTFSESNFGTQIPPFSPNLPNPPNPTTPNSINTAITELFTPNIDQEFHNSVNQGFQDQENLELSNEFPPRLNNNPVLDKDELFHPHHISGQRPLIEHTSQGSLSAGPNRRPPKHFRKPQPNGSLRKPNKNQGRFVPHNGRVPRQLQRRPQQQPPRGIGSNNGRRQPLDQPRQPSRAAPSVWSTIESIFASARGRFRSSRSRRGS